MVLKEFSANAPQDLYPNFVEINFLTLTIQYVADLLYATRLIELIQKKINDTDEHRGK